MSFLDGPVLATEVARALRRETRFLVAAEMFRKPLIGWILRSADQIPIRRGEGDGAALDEVIETVSRGGMAAIAPEGRVDDHAGRDGMQRLRSGRRADRAADRGAGAPGRHLGDAGPMAAGRPEAAAAVPAAARDHDRAAAPAVGRRR